MKAPGGSTSHLILGPKRPHKEARIVQTIFFGIQIGLGLKPKSRILMSIWSLAAPQLEDTAHVSCNMNMQEPGGSEYPLFENSARNIRSVVLGLRKVLRPKTSI